MRIFARTLFALFLAGFVIAVFLTKFHGAAESFTATLSYDWKFANGQISNTAVSNKYLVSTEDAAPAIPRPVLPDISGYTVEKISAKAPAYKPGKVVLIDMEGVSELREFAKEDGRIQRQRLTQLSVAPQVILIQEGDYDLPHLAEAVRYIAPGKDLLREEGRRYTLRFPVLVGAKASLTISGKDVEELRLSQEGVSFLASAGDLYMLGTKITGWNEKNGSPSKFDGNDQTYRPFVVTWSGGHMYAAGTKFESLGYRKGKSYGFSYSNCSFCLRDNPGLARPTGAVVGSTFTDMFYGYYSFEADDVAIVGNTYANNIIYGIDPHYCSRRLIIAKNNAYGSGHKHGIIVSRQVDGCWIFDNYSHDNNGSGIMIDRTSVNNVIVNNVTSNNKGDGITFYESQNNMTWGNKVFGNGKSGIRARNSWNIRLVNDQVTDNGSVPIVVYTAAIEPKEPERDFKIDPYTQKASAEISGLIVKTQDRKPMIKVEGIDSLSLSHVQTVSGGQVFADILFTDETDIVNGMDKPGKEIDIARKTAVLELIRKAKAVIP